MPASETTPLQPPQPPLNKPRKTTSLICGTVLNVSEIPPRWMGFAKGYNLILFLLTAGLFSAYCIFRLPSLHFETWLNRAATGEKFWFKDGLMKVAMTLHLWSVLRESPFNLYN
jgi:hypothetical protein